YVRTPPLVVSQIDTTVNCLLDSLSFSSQATQTGCTPIVNNVVSVAWDFGDVASGPNNTSNLLAPVHLFSSAGNFVVTLIVNYNCYSDTIVDTLTLVSCHPVVTLIGDTICAGSCANLTAIGSGGIPPYTFTWTPNIGSGAGPHQVCPNTTTTYYVLITDSVNDTSSTSAVVVVNQLPVLAMNMTSTLCNGDNTGTATVTPAGNNPFSYLWSTSPVQITQTAVGLFTGTYTVTVSDANGCSQTASILVTESPPLSSLTAITNSICTACNGSITANPSGGTPGYTYAWSTVPVQNTQTSIGLCPAVYTVTITDANNCTVSVSANLNSTPQNVPVSVTSQNNIVCFGDCNGDITVNPTGGTAPFNYSWSTVPVQITSTASALCAGSFTVSVTDANGCIGSASATLTEPNALSFNVSSNQIICFGQTTPLTASALGGTPGYNFTWNPGNFSGPTIN
ncbi:MAG: SprB repeat-containing protein, partial [Bacteroidia bacterium]|nr:SprB repeat-containing protein [Bacteroidia bacterium]